MDDSKLKLIIEKAGEEERGFLVMFVPRQIGPHAGHDSPAPINGFPENLLYAGARESKSGTRLESCCYRHRRETYAEAPNHRQMTYYPDVHSPYWVRIKYEIQTGYWEISKYKNETLLVTACGADFRGAMMQATLIGLQPDEPVDEDC